MSSTSLLVHSRESQPPPPETSNPVYISVANSSHWLSSAHFSGRTLSIFLRPLTMKGAETVKVALKRGQDPAQQHGG